MSIGRVHIFLEARDVSDDVFWLISVLRRTIAQEGDRERVQSKLTNYFKYVDK